ncbi:DEAD/DEAH box helicase [Corallococcus sicarius]|uniref:DEAD/DEAH box helicase n=1 Tax=Corallococcus sicarius TaxID=2316726 RepID=UPI001FCA154D|nr:DEAD/DEAH box helicase [Corallococcus sicarius]
MDLLGLERQSIRCDVVGIPGGTRAQYKIRIEGEPLSTASEAIPWVVTPVDGKTFPLTPTAAWASSEARLATHASPQQQLAVVARLRGMLDDASQLLGGRVQFTAAGFLKTFEPQVVTRVGLHWEPEPDTSDVVSLRSYAVLADGSQAPLPLSSLRPGGIAGSDSRRPLLLPEGADEVLEKVRPLQRRLVGDVTREMEDPTLLVPEGRDVDSILDLSLYSQRVAGFEVLRGKQPGEGREGSGLVWIDPPADSEAFALTIHVEQGSTLELLKFRLHSREDALDVLARNDAALKHAPTTAMTIGGQQLFPSEALGRQLRTALKLSEQPPEEGELRMDPDGSRHSSGKVGAIVRELNATPADTDVALEESNSVPWDLLRTALRPGVTLKPHQNEGLAWLWRHAQSNASGVLLADDMGLGKTLQVACLLTLRLLADGGGKRPQLVVCPTILLDNWRQELARFFQEDLWPEPFILHGPELRAVKRGEGLNTDFLARQRMILTNYETLGAYQRSLLKVDFDVVVFDEAHNLKNPDTLRSRAARALKRSFAIALTGTPVENELFDVWALYDAIQSREPRVFGVRASFREQHGGEHGAASLRLRLRYPSAQSTLLRREKAQALKDLPPKLYQRNSVEMTALQEEQERLIAQQAPKRGAFWALAALQKLYQHPALLSDARGMSVQTALRESPKTRLCLELLERVESQGSGVPEKALVFVLSRAMQELMARLIKEKFRLGHVPIINGEPENRRVALQSIDEFSRAKGFQVLLLSPLAAGAGLNIVAANHVIHYGRWWNPAKEDQATDRAHRIGQVRPVHVYYPLLHRQGRVDAGFDLRLHELVERKRGLAHDFLSPNPDDAQQYAGVFQEGVGL